MIQSNLCTVQPSIPAGRQADRQAILKEVEGTVPGIPFHIHTYLG